MAVAHRILLSAMLLATVPVASRAAPRPSITMNLTADDGTHIQAIDVSDLNVSLSRSLPTPKTGADADTGSELMDQASLMLDISALSNPGLINWAAKGGPNSSVELKVSGSQAMTYVLTGISQWSLAMSHSTTGGEGQVSLSIGAKHMTVNGITVN